MIKKWMLRSAILAGTVYVAVLSFATEPITAPGASKPGETGVFVDVGTIRAQQFDAQSGAREGLAGGLAAGSPNFFIEWLSINGGGDIAASSANFESGVTVGQHLAGEMTSTSYGVGLGFWYGIEGTQAVCPIGLVGDINLSGGVNSTDIISLVNYVLKAGPEPLPCEANGDANCSAVVNSTDIIVLVNFVLKGGPPPCDVCALIPGTWSCP